MRTAITTEALEAVHNQCGQVQQTIVGALVTDRLTAIGLRELQSKLRDMAERLENDVEPFNPSKD